MQTAREALEVLLAVVDLVVKVVERVRVERGRTVERGRREEVVREVVLATEVDLGIPETAAEGVAFGAVVATFVEMIPVVDPVPFVTLAACTSPPFPLFATPTPVPTAIPTRSKSKTIPPTILQRFSFLLACSCSSSSPSSFDHRSGLAERLSMRVEPGTYGAGEASSGRGAKEGVKEDPGRGTKVGGEGRGAGVGSLWA